MAGKTRLVHDSFGELRVPASALYGAQTQRAVQNFPVSGLAMPRAFLRALGQCRPGPSSCRYRQGHCQRRQ